MPKLFANHPNLLQKITAKQKNVDEEKDKKDKTGIKKNNANIFNQDREFKLATQCHIATQKDRNAEDFSLIVRQISIDKLAEENKRLNPQKMNQPASEKNPNEALS